MFWRFIAIVIALLGFVLFLFFSQQANQEATGYSTQYAN